MLNSSNFNKPRKPRRMAAPSNSCSEPKKLTRLLAPGGYFFAGHSESLQGMDLALIPVAPSAYRKPE
jgi:hypothetical protein